MNLPSLPIVPRALSLGLDVANRRFPSDHAPTLRHRAKANVEEFVRSWENSASNGGHRRACMVNRS